MTPDRKLAIFRTELRRLAAEKRRRRNPAQGVSESEDVYLHGFPQLTEDEARSRVEGCFPKEAIHILSLRKLRGHNWKATVLRQPQRRNPSHSYGCSCFGCR